MKLTGANKHLTRREIYMAHASILLVEGIIVPEQDKNNMMTFKGPGRNMPVIKYGFTVEEQGNCNFLLEDDADIDATEGRDDSNADDTDGSIEVQPNEKRPVLALVSEGVIDRVQSSNQRRALFLLDARGVPYEKVDGMDPAQREVREGLFELAGFGAANGKVCYPQFFFVGEHGTISYVGDFDRLLSLNDASDIPKEILEGHPDLETWERVFVNLVEPAVIASP